MHIAAFAGHAQCVQALSRHGANVNQANSVRVCPSTAEPTLTRREAQKGDTPTHMAAHGGHVDCIDALVRNGADVNQANEVSVTRPFLYGPPRGSAHDEAPWCVNAQIGMTPLHFAAQQKHVQCIDALVRHGAAVDKATHVCSGDAWVRGKGTSRVTRCACLAEWAGRRHSGVHRSPGGPRGVHRGARSARHRRKPDDCRACVCV